MNEHSALLGLDDDFTFQCRPGLDCFTTCCAGVNIFLTPFDVLRLTRRLDMDTTLFLANHTLALRGPNPVIPLVVLKMDPQNDHRCCFVTREGCRVYDDRPWSCRMFPLDLIGRQDFKIMADKSFCRGLDQPATRSVKAYLIEQGVVLSAELDAAYQEIVDHPRMAELDVDNPKISRMVYMACYDLDRFREFVLESSFLERFEIKEARLRLIETDRVELLKLGFDWVKFGLFAEKTIALKPGQGQESGPA